MGEARQLALRWEQLRVIMDLLQVRDCALCACVSTW